MIVAAITPESGHMIFRITICLYYVHRGINKRHKQRCNFNSSIYTTTVADGIDNMSRSSTSQTRIYYCCCEAWAQPQLMAQKHTSIVFVSIFIDELISKDCIFINKNP